VLSTSRAVSSNLALGGRRSRLRHREQMIPPEICRRRRRSTQPLPGAPSWGADRRTPRCVGACRSEEAGMGFGRSHPDRGRRDPRLGRERWHERLQREHDRLHPVRRDRRLSALIGLLVELGRAGLHSHATPAQADVGGRSSRKTFRRSSQSTSFVEGPGHPSRPF
jgi:hypothetical protein